MKKFKDFLREFFIDGLSGMATGLFATLIIGTIIAQFSLIIPGKVGNYVLLIGKIAQMLTGAGVGCGVAVKLKAKPLTALSAAVCGMAGAFASQIIAGTVLVDGKMSLSGPGEPLGAFLAAISAVYLGKVVAGKTKLDILVTPLSLITVGCTVGLLIGPPISGFMAFVGDLIKFGTEQAPIPLGIIVAVLMGMALTLPISSAAIAIILGLSGIAA
ncbi:MAG: PTS sugar transporter subunit IIC, partial [Lachnospiraceae bacterium]|nr:PTS sugar transporter subunit IIC [Lachnospiraceae bacterium]